MAKQDLTKRGKPGRPRKQIDKPTSIKEMSEAIVKPQPEAAKKYKCCACGKSSDAAWQYPKSFSVLYAATDYHLPICNDCINSLYNVIAEKFSNYYDVYRRICMMYDIYYCDKLADLAIKESNPENRVTKYIAKASLVAYANKTYGDTIAEEGSLHKTNESGLTSQCESNQEIESISQEVKDFWGFGLDAKQYHYLDTDYQAWINDYDISSDPAYKSILKKICFLELRIQEAMENGDDISKLTREFNALLGSANLQPKQKKDDREITDSMCFGNLIKEWENEAPIAEPLPEFKDVDNIRHYITVWFLGHLCKMIGIKNKYSEEYENVSKEYEEEVEKYTVDKPEYNEEEELNKFDDLFGSINES